LKAEGDARELLRQIQDERKKMQTDRSAQVDVQIPEIPKGFGEYIKSRGLVRNLSVGEFSVTLVAE
jgi:hypothetical protein